MKLKYMFFGLILASALSAQSQTVGMIDVRCSVYVRASQAAVWDWTVVIPEKSIQVPVGGDIAKEVGSANGLTFRISSPFSIADGVLTLEMESEGQTTFVQRTLGIMAQDGLGLTSKSRSGDFTSIRCVTN